MKERILVVDDDAAITTALRRALSYEGYHVDIAHDGEDGLRDARDRVPDLVILDVLMPGIDGLEFCRRVRASDDTPILMLTARDEVADRVRGIDAGADDYLVKPFASRSSSLAFGRSCAGGSRASRPLRSDLPISRSTRGAARPFAGSGKSPGSSNANKVLIDDVPANDIGGAIDLGLLAVAGTDQIEVLRGPNSALYGSDALAGVVSINTPRGTTPLPEITYSVDGGNFGTYRQEGTLGGSHKQFDYFSDFSRFDTSNGAVRDSFHNGTFAGNVGWTPGPNTEFRATVRRLVTAAGEPNAIQLFGIPDDAGQKEQANLHRRHVPAADHVAMAQSIAVWGASVALSVH